MSAELDYMEYASDELVRAAYPSSEEYAYAEEESHDEVCNTNGDLSGEFGDWGKIAQSFQLGSQISCKKVAVSIEKAGNPTDNVILRIETDSGGFPSGNLVDANAETSRPMSEITTPPYAFEEFVFDNAFTLESGTTYHIVLTRSGSRDTVNKLENELDDASPSYASGEATKSNGGVWEALSADWPFKVYSGVLCLQCYSEATIKQQGSYSLKGYAKQTDSLNEYFEKTLGSPIDLSGKDDLCFDIRASRTGSNIKIGIHDSGGNWTEITPNVASADTWQTVGWDISGVADADKDAIDKIRITIVNADANNTFYIDNMYVLIDEGDVAVSGGGNIVVSGFKSFFNFEDNLIGEFRYIENIDELRNHIIIKGEGYAEEDKGYKVISGETILDEKIVDRHIAKYNVRVWKTAPQSIPNQTWTPIEFDYDVWDTADMHDISSNKTRLVCKEAGNHFAFACIQFESDVNGVRGLMIAKNYPTGGIYAREFSPADQEGVTAMSLMTIVNLEIDDYIELYVWQTSGGALNVNCSIPETPSFGMEKHIQ